MYINTHIYIHIYRERISIYNVHRALWPKTAPAINTNLILLLTLTERVKVWRQRVNMHSAWVCLPALMPAHSQPWGRITHRANRANMNYSCWLIFRIIPKTIYIYIYIYIFKNRFQAPGIVQIDGLFSSVSIALTKTKNCRISTWFMSKFMMCLLSLTPTTPQISLFEEIRLQCDLIPNRFVQNDRTSIISLLAFQ